MDNVSDSSNVFSEEDDKTISEESKEDIEYVTEYDEELLEILGFASNHELNEYIDSEVITLRQRLAKENEIDNDNELVVELTNISVDLYVQTGTSFEEIEEYLATEMTGLGEEERAELLYRETRSILLLNEVYTSAYETVIAESELADTDTDSLYLPLIDTILRSGEHLTELQEEYGISTEVFNEVNGLESFDVEAFEKELEEEEANAPEIDPLSLDIRFKSDEE